MSLVQLIASALAAVTAAVAGSYLGVNGTVIGAAIASVLSVIGTAIYSHSLHRTGHRVRAVVPASARWLPEPGATAPLAPVLAAGEATPRPAPAPAAERRLHPLARLATAAVIVFAAALGVLTGVELVAGRPVSDLVSGTSAKGTTVFGSQLSPHSTTPAPAVTVTVTPSVVVTTPTVTQTAPAVTVTSTPTVTPGSSGSTGSTGSATGSAAPTNTPGP